MPIALYQKVAQRAQNMDSSLEEEILTALATAFSEQDDLSDTTVDRLTQLRYLNNSELWQAAQITVSTDENARMQVLMFKRQSIGLTQDEQIEAEALVAKSEQVMLLRAQAIALLRERGHDVSHLIHPPLPS
jgi:hypothetical protein